MWSVSVSSWPLTSILFEAGLKQVCSWIATCFRHAFDLLATRSRKSATRFAAGLQLARIMECGLTESGSELGRLKVKVKELSSVGQLCKSGLCGSI